MPLVVSAALALVQPEHRGVGLRRPQPRHGFSAMAVWRWLLAGRRGVAAVGVADLGVEGGHVYADVV